MLRVYGIKTCDSVRKALRFLKANDIPHTFIDMRETPVGCDTMERWLEHADIGTLFNAKSTTYRQLDLKSKGLDDEGKKAWLCRENLLIKRPVIEKDGTLIVGFDETRYEKEFLS